MIEMVAVKREEKAELRRSFEFGAYMMLTHYLAERYGLKELDWFAMYWAELAAKGRERIVAKSKSEFIELEAKIEKVWVDREPKSADAKGYVGVVDVCPLRKATNDNRSELPVDYFCDHICATIYPEGYKLLGLKGSITKSEKGCTVSIDLS